jgi:hypothetical protein
MLAVHQIATEGATKAPSFAADTAFAAHQLLARVKAGFSLSEAASAAARAVLALYGLAFLTNLALVY